MNFKQLKVIRKINLTPNASLITLEVPIKDKAFFEFYPGQYISVKHKNKDGVYIIRCYSLCGDLEDDNISFCVKKVQNGVVSTFLCDTLQVEDSLSVSSAEGDFNLLESNGFQKENSVFVSAGSGITPIKSMIEHLIKENYKGNIFLIYGNNSENEIIFKNFLDKINNENENLKIIFILKETPLEWDGEQGRLIVSTISELFSNYNVPIKNSCYYVSGPQGIIDNTTTYLLSKNVTADNIYSEKFFTSLPTYLDANKELSANIILNNENRTINFKGNQSLLDATLASGINAPHSCRIGTCLSCSAILKSGKVFIQNHSKLTEDQIENNVILSCQCYAKDNKVVLDFDSKVEKGLLHNRNKLIALGAILGFILLIFFLYPQNDSYLAKGAYNTGHEDLQCIHCHKDAPGSSRQQIQHNVKHLLGAKTEPVHFGKIPVGNDACLSCHSRPNDTHPVHRFLEPKFKEARENFHPENCVSCHAEHKEERVTYKNMGFCVDCHKDIKIENDPLDLKHEELIAMELWNTCIQCHDFHGNHVMQVADKINDTIPLKEILDYYEGGKDPFSDVKKYLAEIDSIN